MFNEKGGSQKSNLIDLDKARLSPNFEDLKKQNEDIAEKSCQKEALKYKEVVDFAKKRVGDDIAILCKGNMGHHCIISKELDPFEDLLPMLMTGILTVADIHQLDPLHYVSAIFNTVYQSLMDRAVCSQCDKFDAQKWGCACTKNCNNCDEDKKD